MSPVFIGEIRVTNPFRAAQNTKQTQIYTKKNTKKTHTPQKFSVFSEKNTQISTLVVLVNLLFDFRFDVYVLFLKMIVRALASVAYR